MLQVERSITSLLNQYQDDVITNVHSLPVDANENQEKHSQRSYGCVQLV